MDINKGFTEDTAMSGKLKMTEKIGGGNTTESDSPENSKSKKISESPLGQVDPKNVKISLAIKLANRLGLCSRSCYPV